MNDNLTFRLFEPQDLAGVLQLWEDESGWGGVTEKQFNDWFVDTPCGECLIVVALDGENRVVGQEIFTPSKICINGKEKKALRLSAPILAKEYRARMSSATHPVVEMYKIGAQAALDNGYSLIYSFPSIGWLPVIKLLFPLIGVDINKVVRSQIECHAISLKAFLYEPNKKDKCNANSVSLFNHEYNTLWRSTIKNFPLGNAVVRDSNWLKWKLGDYLVLEVRKAKRLTGYVAVKKDTGLITDALARTPADFETVIKKAIEKLHFLKDTLPTDDIKLMHTHVTSSIIEKMGFQKIDYKFGFWCYSPDDSISFENLQMARWFMMPND